VKKTRLTKKTVLKIYSVVIAVVFALLILHDAVSHIVSFQRAGCTIEVFDAYGNAEISTNGVCYHRGLDLWTFRSLGKTDANTLILVTHFFTSKDAVGLGVSDTPDIFFIITHPVSLFYTVKGTTNTGETYMAVSPNIVSISSSLDNKTVIIVTCKLPRIEEFAKALLEAGARKVIITNTPTLDEGTIGFFVEKIVNIKDADKLCSLPIFTCYSK